MMHTQDDMLDVHIKAFQREVHLFLGSWLDAVNIVAAYDWHGLVLDFANTPYILLPKC